MKVGTAIDRVLEVLAATRSPATVGAYRSSLRKFERFLWDDDVMHVSQLRVPGHWVEFAERLATLAYAPRSRTVHNAAARRLLDWLVMHGHVGLDERGRLALGEAVRQYGGRVTFDPRVPDLGLINDIARHAESIVGAYEIGDSPAEVELRDAVVFLFMLETGCRAAEVVGLDVGDVHLGDRTARVLGKGSKWRHVMFGYRASSAVWAWLESFDPHYEILDGGPLFRNSRGDRLSTKVLRDGVTRVRLAAAKATGNAALHSMRLTPHGLRHAFATAALAATGNLALVQDLLGHASPETTRVYARFSDRVKRGEYDRIWNGDATNASNSD